MMNLALDDFMKRFGDDDPNKSTVQNNGRKPVKSVSEITPYGVNEFSSGLEGVSDDIDFTKKDVANSTNQGPGIGGYADMAMGAVAIGKSFTGDQFDTSAEGGGPGKSGGAILGGATTGAQAGMVFGPWGAAIGAGLGAIGSGLGHKKAMGDWRDNQKKHNLNLNAIEEAKREDEYAMSEGLASMNTLKGLRKKQLGILS